jgi:uroporphyrinogen decarboxylase
LDGGVWTINRAKISFEDMFAMQDGGAELVLKTAEDCKSDIVWPACGCFFLMLRAIGVECDYSKKQLPGEVVSTLINSLDEVSKLDASTIREQLLSDKGIQAMLLQTKIIKESVGESKYLATIVPAPFTAASQIMGVQKFMVELFNVENDFTPLLEYCLQLSNTFAEIFIESGVDFIFIGDPVASGDLISPVIFEKFSAPYIKKLSGMIGDKVDVKMLHICGNTAARLEPVRDLGVNVFSLDSVDLQFALDTAKGYYAIAGNMSPVHIMQDLTAEEVYKKCTELAQVAGLKGGYIMMPGCDLTAGTPLENILAMVDAAHNVNK